MSEVLTGFWVIAYRETLRLLRERARLLSSLAIPLLMLVIFGAGFNRIVSALGTDVDLIQFMFPGVVSIGVLMTSLLSGLSVVWDREFGFLKVVLVAPLNRVGVALGKASGGTVVAVLQGFILMALAPVFGLSLNGLALLKLLLLLTVLAFTLSSMGILLGSRMRSQQGFHGVVELLLLPLVFFSGVFFPVDRVPAWLGTMAKLNPLTYGVDAIRQTVLQGKEQAALASAMLRGDGGMSLGVTVFGHTMGLWEDLLVVACFGVLIAGLAAWSFNRQE